MNHRTTAAFLFIAMGIVLLASCAVTATAEPLSLATSEDPSTMSVSQLRTFLLDRGAECEGCLEKRDLIDRALAVKDWLTEDDRVAMELIGYQESAMTHLNVMHVSSPSLPEGQQQQPQPQHMPQRTVVCEDPLNNGTVYCHDVNAMRKHAAQQ